MIALVSMDAVIQLYCIYLEWIFRKWLYNSWNWEKNLIFFTSLASFLPRGSGSDYPMQELLTCLQT